LLKTGNFTIFTLRENKTGSYMPKGAFRNLYNLRVVIILLFISALTNNLRAETWEMNNIFRSDTTKGIQLIQPVKYIYPAPESPVPNDAAFEKEFYGLGL
jgi:hypothetical protein